MKTAAEVNASLINGVRVRFIPEVERNSGNLVTSRSMVNTKIVWEEWRGATTGSSADDGQGGNPSDGGLDENPLG